jgi:hypothetical protein
MDVPAAAHIAGFYNPVLSSQFLRQVPFFAAITQGLTQILLQGLIATFRK